MLFRRYFGHVWMLLHQLLEFCHSVQSCLVNSLVASKFRLPLRRVGEFLNILISGEARDPFVHLLIKLLVGQRFERVRDVIDFEDLISASFFR